MQFYGDHVEHDPTLLYPVRVIEIVPPRCYNVDPRPHEIVRRRYEVDDDTWLTEFRHQLLVENETPATWGPPYRIVSEYAHQVAATEWHTAVAYFDEEAQQYVHVGWYELRLGWWWGREPAPPATVPEERVQRLRAYKPPRSEALRLLDYEIQLQQRVYGNVEKWSDLPHDAKWLARTE